MKTPLVSITRAELFLALAYNGPMSSSALGRLFGAEKANVNGAMQRAKRLGYAIALEHEPNDYAGKRTGRTSTVWTITSRGKAWLDERLNHPADKASALDKLKGAER